MPEFSSQQIEKRDERVIVSPFRDRFETRIVVEFLVSLFLWI